MDTNYVFCVSKERREVNNNKEKGETRIAMCHL